MTVPRCRTLAAPVFGSISAVILALAFAGGLVEGGLFPRLEFVKLSECTNGVSNVGGPAVQQDKNTNAPPADATATLTHPGAPGPGIGAPDQPPAGQTSSGGPAPMPADTLRPSTNPSHAATTTTNGPPGTAPSSPGDLCPDVCGYCWCLRGRLSLPPLLIWSVIAGFSERLVPDLLTRLTGRVKAKSSGALARGQRASQRCGQKRAQVPPGRTRKTRQHLGHQLQAHQFEPKRPNAKKQQVLAGAVANAGEFSGLYYSGPVACLTLDQCGKILEGNPAGAALLGVPRANRRRVLAPNANRTGVRN